MRSLAAAKEFFKDLAVARRQLALAYKMYGKELYLHYIIKAPTSSDPPSPEAFVGSGSIVHPWVFFRPHADMVENIKHHRGQLKLYGDNLQSVADMTVRIAADTLSELRKFELTYSSTSCSVTSDTSLIGLKNGTLYVPHARKLMVDRLRGGVDTDKFVVDIRDRVRNEEFVTARAIWLERKRDKTERRFTLAERRGHVAWVHDDPNGTCAFSIGTRETAARSSRNKLLRAIDAKIKGEKKS